MYRTTQRKPTVTWYFTLDTETWTFPLCITFFKDYMRLTWVLNIKFLCFTFAKKMIRKPKKKLRIVDEWTNNNI